MEEVDVFWRDGVQGGDKPGETEGKAETWGWKEERRVPETDKGRCSGVESEKVLGHGSDCLRIRSLRK